MSEEKLIRRMQDGDSAAFEEVFNTYQNKVYAVALGMVKNEQDALDVCQDVFVKVYTSMHKMKGESSLFTWIYRITVNVCIDRIRKSSRGTAVAIDEPELNSVVADSAAQPEEELVKKSDVELVREALFSLPEDMREVLILREFDGLSYEEIAKATGNSLGTVKSRISRAREGIRKIIVKKTELF